MAGEASPGDLHIAVHGTGRMGRSICDAAAGRSGLRIDALVGPEQPEWTLPPSAVWAPALDDLSARPGLVIDFSLPAGTLAAAAWCGSHGVPLLSGVTGLPADTRQAIARCGEAVPVLWSPNLSKGVNLLADLVGRAAAVIGPGAPVRIWDLHHQWKKDAPSGTALMLGEAVARRRGGDADGIAYESEREGEVIGEHSVRFELAGEEIELVHRAGDRSIYARGALDAGLWLVRQDPGLYSAADWLAAL